MAKTSLPTSSSKFGIASDIYKLEMQLKLVLRMRKYSNN